MSINPMETVTFDGDRVGSMGRESASIGEVITAVWRHKLVIMLLIVGITSLAAMTVWSLPQTFVSTATVLIDPRKAQIGELQTGGGGDQLDQVTVRTQAAIIQSPAIAARVVDALDLTRVPEFKSVIDAPPPLLQQGVALARQYLGYAAPESPPLTELQRKQLAGALLQRNVSVVNDGRSYLVDIRVRANDGQLSAAIANEFANAYMEFNRKLKTDAIIQTSTSLDEQLARLQRKVQDAEEAVDVYRNNNGLVTMTTGGDDRRGVTVSERQLEQISMQLVQASSQRAEKEASLTQVLDAQHGHGRIDALPEVVGSPLIARLRSQQADLDSRLASVGTSALSANPNLHAITAASADIRQKISAEVGKIAESMASSVAAARLREQILRGMLAALESRVAIQGQSEIRLRELQSQADVARTVYTDYLHRFQQTASQSLMQFPDAELISVARVPLEADGPQRARLLAMAAGVAVMLATFVALLLERRGGGFRTPEELERVTGLTVMGFVPMLRRGEDCFGTGRAAFQFQEAVSHVRGVLGFGEPNRRAQVVVITSAVPREGKTHFATALARNVSRHGGRALVIDCDLQRPSVAATLGLPSDLQSKLGVSPRGGSAAQSDQNLPAGRLRIAHGVAEEAGLDVSVLPGSRAVPASIRHVRDEIERARSEYDLIVLDAPSVLACADADLFSGVADGVIMLVRWGQTPRGAVLAALRLLQVYGVRTLGAVIAQVNVKDLWRRGDHAYLYRRFAGYNK